MVVAPQSFIMSVNRGSERFGANFMKMHQRLSEKVLTQICVIFNMARGLPALFEGPESLLTFSPQRRIAPPIAVRTKDSDENRGSRGGTVRKKSVCK